MTQLLSALPLAYMAAACYYSLFQLGMFSFYHVVPHATNAHSLLMNAAQVRRLFPLLARASSRGDTGLAVMFRAGLSHCSSLMKSGCAVSICFCTTELLQSTGKPASRQTDRGWQLLVEASLMPYRGRIRLHSTCECGTGVILELRSALIMTGCQRLCR